MRRARALVVLTGLTFALFCRIEDHTPAGSRLDEDAIRAVLLGYYACLSDRTWSNCKNYFWPHAIAGTLRAGKWAPNRGELPADTLLDRITRKLQHLGSDDYSIQVTRLDLRQAGDLASAWVSLRVRARSPEGILEERDGVEQMVLRRIGAEWRIAYWVANLTLTP